MRTAQTVQIEDIPLPDMSEKPLAPMSQPQMPFGTMPIPPPNFPPPLGGVPIPPSIQNAIAAHQKSLAEEKIAKEPKQKDPPGCPPGPPPSLLSMRDLDSDYESDDSDRGRRSPVSKRTKHSRRYSTDRSSDRSGDRNSDSDSEVDVPKPTSVQQRMLAIAGQKYDDFMKELENVHSQNDERSKQSDRRRSDDGSRSSDDSNRNDDDEPKQKKNESNTNAPEIRPTEPLRKENPAALPTLSSVPAPPMPPPMLKIPRPPPPPMGNIYFYHFFFHKRLVIPVKMCIISYC